MSRILKQHVKNKIIKILAKGLIPERLIFQPGKTTQILFSDGTVGSSSCLRCEDKPCTYFSDEETSPSNLEYFPADRKREVCPADAIIITDIGDIPNIDSSKCIFCGVCASRCPVGAIKLDPAKGAVVEETDSHIYTETTEIEINEWARMKRILLRVRHDGIFMIENDVVIEKMFKRIEIAWNRIGDNFPNYLTRNLLIGAGIGASTRRKGNNHMRMDIILSPPGVKRGVAEVEFGQEAVLDAPRDMLDSLAVLKSRYNWDLKDNEAIVVASVLPNRRSEYWHIIEDIKNIFDIRIGTVTVMALIIAIWNKQKIDFKKGQAFYFDRNNQSYVKDILENIINRPLKLKKINIPQINIVK